MLSRRYAIRASPASVARTSCVRACTGSPSEGASRRSDGDVELPRYQRACQTLSEATSRCCRSWGSRDRDRRDRAVSRAYATGSLSELVGLSLGPSTSTHVGAACSQGRQGGIVPRSGGAQCPLGWLSPAGAGPRNARGARRGGAEAGFLTGGWTFESQGAWGIVRARDRVGSPTGCAHVWPLVSKAPPRSRADWRGEELSDTRRLDHAGVHEGFQGPGRCRPAHPRARRRARGYR